MSIAKFFTVCSKNSTDRNYSGYIKMIQRDGYQHYIHTDGFYCACYTKRAASPDDITALLSLTNSFGMEIKDYPDVNGAICCDITKRIDAKDDDSEFNAGVRIMTALKNAKIGKDTSINPATGEVFHDKANHPGFIRAKYLSQFTADCVALYYHGDKDDCHRFTLLQGKTSITLFVAGMVDHD